MNGDTIAVSSLSTFKDTMGVQQFSTNIRVIDLATMNNTQALRVPLNTKTEPYDLMYMPKSHQLVLLQDIYLPSLLGVQNTFVHINPYATAPYNAKCWFEVKMQKPFSSLNQLNDKTYVASGGEYWCMKNMNVLSPDSCYKADAIPIIPIDKVPNAMELDRYYDDINFVSFLSVYSSPGRADPVAPCVINN